MKRYSIINQVNYEFNSHLFYVYELCDDIGPFYVGKGRGFRLIQHILNITSYKKSKSNVHLYNRINKIIESNQTIVCKIVFKGFEPECFRKEIELITKYGKIINGSGFLLNILNGGEGFTTDGLPVDQYTMWGTFLRSYKNAKEAARINGFKHYSLICSCCRNRETSYKGFLWTYKGHSPKTLTKNRPVFQYTPDGEFISVFKNASQAAKSVGLKSSSDISNVCAKRQRSYSRNKYPKGFKWSYDPPIDFDIAHCNQKGLQL